MSKRRNLRPAHLYVFFSLAVLMTTSLLWSYAGAQIHQSNADQLVNPYLFEDWQTFRQALFPEAHSFLIKWPLFFLISLIGPSNLTYAVFTIAIAVVTVMSLAFILYRIDKRPLVFGTLILALSSVLLLVPPNPLAGELLPVNMAMITTRNLEYLLYIASLIFLIRAPRIKSLRFGLALSLLSLLILSDRLFLVLSAGGATLALITYLIRKQQSLVRLFTRLLLIATAAYLISIVIFWLCNASGFTHITNNANSVPTGLVPSLRRLALGTIYAVLGLLTNFGANPIFDVTILRAIPHQLPGRLLNLGGIGFTINLAIFALGASMTYRLVVSSFGHRKKQGRDFDNPTKVSLMLVWSTLTVFLAFALSDHYYAADARYLTISVFAVFISSATYLRNTKVQLDNVLVVLVTCSIITGSIVAGIVSMLDTFHVDQTALEGIDHRNSIVAQAVKNHHVDILVGDYWRVTPIKLNGPRSINVMPLVGCNQAQNVLSSRKWQPDLSKHSFAYLLSLDNNQTDFQGCTLNQIIFNHGRPNSSILIAGSLDQPSEALLFYDRGSKKSSPTVALSRPSTVLPIALNQLPHLDCPTQTTVMNIVAHEDDDLLFMNPDTIHSVRAGNCVRSVYLTAGDSGSNELYWQSREKGSEAAYAFMIGTTKDIWIERIIKLNDRQFIRVANPQNDPKISLIFMRLPDGNLQGQGFPSNKYQSLARLEAGSISQINSVDGQSVYTSQQLTSTLSSLMQAYRPSEIRSQATYNISRLYPDHSDHMTTGRYVQSAYLQYGGQATVKFYIGYPVREFPQNVWGADLTSVQETFDAYNNFDKAVCQTIKECSESPTGAYSERQYTTP